MPKRPLPPDPPETPAVLKAIKLARQNGKQLSMQEAKEFEAFRSRSNIRKLPNTIIKTRRGQTVYRTEGKAGADLMMHPEVWVQKKVQRDLEVGISKVARRAPNPQLGVAARQKRSETLRLIVEKLAKKYENLGRFRAARIAKEVGISAKHVRFLLRTKRT